MISPIFLLLAAPLASLLLLPTVHAECYSSEGPGQLCYNPPYATPQGVDVADVVAIADYLRSYGGEVQPGRLFSMAAAADNTQGCAEWTVHRHGSALAVAKHIDDTADSAVLFADIATTIDGSGDDGFIVVNVSTTETRKAASLLDCGCSGGSLGVQVNLLDPAYDMSTYPAGYNPEGILIKIVASGV